MRDNAMQCSFDEVDVKGTKALFCESRIAFDSVPKPLFVYEVRYADEDWTEPTQITNKVLVNFLGTLITDRPLQFPDGKGIYLDYGEVDFYPGNMKTLSQFAKENNIKLKAPLARER